METRYRIAKIVASIFGTTTVILFILAYGGILYLFLSVELSVTIYLVNFALFVTSLFFFIYYRVHRDIAMRGAEKILEAATHDITADKKEASELPETPQKTP